MEAAAHISKRAAELRRDFDRGFADPPFVVSETRQDLLAIRLGARRLAIRLSEIAGLFADKKAFAPRRHRKQERVLEGEFEEDPLDLVRVRWLR